ncbi:MAG TPA: PhnD/SsuA/transferrin family substrate-binding protein, partial [Deinococcales bacterium]|nr:PhnD/SsuA/transferrin family substrate-binding protein [Deinococcales bacterium]
MKKIAIVVAIAAAGSGAFAAENCRVVRMGFNPATDSNVVLTNGKAIGNFLEETVRGIEVNASVSQDYRGLVEAMRSNQLDFAWLSPVSYVDAHRDANAQVLLKSVRGTSPYYWSAFIVRADSKYKTIKDLQGARIAW